MVYGENPALQWGGDTHISKGGNAISIKYSNTLGGGDLSSFINAGLKKKNVLV